MIYSKSKVMKTILYFFTLLATIGIMGQESLLTNYFKPFNVDMSGEVDSVFQVDFEVYDGDENPSVYINYAFDDKGNLNKYTSKRYGASEFIKVQSAYENGDVKYELMTLPYASEDTNKFTRDSKGSVVEIRNTENFTKIQYDNKDRISQIDFGYSSDGFLSHTHNYTYTTNDTYTITESAADKIYATREYVKGQYRLEVIDNVLGGSDITTYSYNEKGDMSQMDISGPDTDITIKHNYEYDDHGNWIKRTDWTQYSDEEAVLDRVSTRKIIYSDGHRTGYDVQY
jgi:hypothetical protein